MSSGLKAGRHGNETAGLTFRRSLKVVGVVG